jgi:ParB-like chromosome segregation protein Spo0J
VRILQLIEHLQRQDLSPIDEAHAYQELMDLEELSPPRVAERLHISAQQVRDRLRLLADQALADAVEWREVSAAGAREIAKLPDEAIAGFRARVEKGERLQTHDVATARARLQQQGVVNPRRRTAGTCRKTNVVCWYTSIRPATGGTGRASHGPATQATPAMDGAREQPASAEDGRPEAAHMPTEHADRAHVLADVVDVLAAGFLGARRTAALAVFRDLLASPEAMTLWGDVITATVRRWESGTGEGDRS